MYILLIISIYIKKLLLCLCFLSTKIAFYLKNIFELYLEHEN